MSAVELNMHDWNDAVGCRNRSKGLGKTGSPIETQHSYCYSVHWCRVMLLEGTGKEKRQRDERQAVRKGEGISKGMRASEKEQTKLGTPGSVCDAVVMIASTMTRRLETSPWVMPGHEKEKLQPKTRPRLWTGPCLAGGIPPLWVTRPLLIICALMVAII